MDIQDREAPASAKGHSHEWLQATLEVTRSLLGGGDEPLATVAHAIRKVSDSDSVLVILPAAGDALMVEVAVGAGTEYLPGYSYRRTGSISGDVLAGGEAILVSDARRSTRGTALGALSVEIDIGPVMFVPLLGRNLDRGVLVVGRRPGRAPFTKQDVEPAVAFANHATLALELADGRMYQHQLAQLEASGRIAGELHDQVLQRLFATGMSMQALATSVGSPHAERIEELVQATDDTIARIRSVIRDLNQIDPDPRAL